jgi:hypothetical protein
LQREVGLLGKRIEHNTRINGIIQTARRRARGFRNFRKPQGHLQLDGWRPKPQNPFCIYPPGFAKAILFNLINSILIPNRKVDLKF